MIIHHEVHEEHEEKINIINLRDLRVLRGKNYEDTCTTEQND